MTQALSIESRGLRCTFLTQFQLAEVELSALGNVSTWGKEMGQGVWDPIKKKLTVALGQDLTVFEGVKRTWEMAQCVKCLPHKHEDLSSNPWHNH